MRADCFERRNARKPRERKSPTMPSEQHQPYALRGLVDDYDVDGEGTCLTTVLIAYASECRKAAGRYQEIAASLLMEAKRAEAAATAAEFATEKPDAK